MKTIDEDNDAFEWYELPLDGISELTIYFDGSGKAMVSWHGRHRPG